MGRSAPSVEITAQGNMLGAIQPIPHEISTGTD
jgi:hypothetical protein